MDFAALPQLPAGLPPLEGVLDTLRTPLGAALFVPLYALWVTLLLPGVWASMLAGALYGTLWGSALVFVGACLGAEAAFLLVFDKYVPDQLSFLMVSAWRLFTYYLILITAAVSFLVIPFIALGWHKFRS